jgi:hypothetical protein
MKTTSLVAALFCITMAASGCGKNDNGAANGVGVPGAPGYYGGTVSYTPGGAATIMFTGSNVYNSGMEIAGGQYSGLNPTVCGYFSNNMIQDCWLFSNYNHPQSTLSIGGSLPVGAAGTITYTGNSIDEPGATVTLVATVPSLGPSYSLYGSNTLISQTVSGQITLPPAFVAIHMPGGIVNPSNIVFDFNITPGSYNSGSPTGTMSINGGIVIFINNNPVFLRI